MVLSIGKCFKNNKKKKNGGELEEKSSNVFEKELSCVHTKKWYLQGMEVGSQEGILQI